MSTHPDINTHANHTDHKRTAHRVLLAILLAAALAATALHPTAGYADQMTVFSCHDPAGEAVGNAGWSTERTSDAFMTAADTCAGEGQGALDLELGPNSAGYPNAARVQWDFDAPAWATIADYELHIAGSYTLPPSGGVGQAFVDASDESDPVYDYRNLGDGSWGASVINRTPPDAVSWIATNASCDGEDGDCPANVTISRLEISAARIMLNDGTTPTVSGVGGSLVSGSPQRGESEISFDAADSGPGIYAAHLVIDGVAQPATVLDSNNGWCKNLGQTNDGTRSFAHPDPCAPSVSTSLPLNTAQLSDGTHTTKLIVEDASGDSTIGWSATITTQNAPINTTPPTTTGQPVSGTAISASPGTWTAPAGAGPTTYAYQWEDCDTQTDNCQAIPGAQNASYTPTAADAGHTLRVQVTAADNDGASSATSTATSTVPTANDLLEPPSAGIPEGTPNGTPASEAASLHLNSSTAITRSYAHRAFKLTGQLTNSQSQPIADATLDVLQQIAGTDTRTLIGHTSTSPTGTFTLTVPTGPSRLIELAYRALSNDANYAATASIRETVQASAQLKITPHNTSPTGTIILTGKIQGPIPPQGTIVELLVYYRGHWEPFRDPRTNSHGSFHVAYQFQGATGRFPFRIQIPTGQADYPYTSGYSNIVDISTT
jgi:hypothetical protein